VSRLSDDKGSIEVVIEAQGKKNGVCSGCGKKRPVYDRTTERRFQYIPIWGLAVVFLYVMRRVLCPDCGVRTERVPWAKGKEQLTERFQWFLASWAKKLSWQEVGESFRVSWDTVFRSVRMAVVWGRRRMEIGTVAAIGVDEIAWRKGRFLTLVYQLDQGKKRLLWVAEDRKTRSLRSFFNWMGKRRSKNIQYVCSDMWKHYLSVIRERAPTALNILDRFHIVQKMNKAVDETRAKEVKELKRDGKEPILTRAKWILLRRRENLQGEHEVRLREIVRANLKTARAYLLKEDFQHFWTYQRIGCATRFFDTWCTRAMRSKIEPMKKIAKTLRSHRTLIFNYFQARNAVQLGVVEGMNNKAKVGLRKSYGIKSPKNVKIALFHRLGDLPEPSWVHRFC
jgi:transposase